MRLQEGHVVAPGEGAVADLGVARMRVLAAGEPTGGAFSLTEFSGQEGAWTVPHVHRAMEESFFVLDGEFVFRLGDAEVDATAGTYVLVPRGTPHAIRAGSGGGRLLTLMVPGGLEAMFFALAQLPPGALTDPAARAAAAATYDSMPVR
jgi:quercetin dioxygenase-like cupin family protein